MGARDRPAARVLLVTPEREVLLMRLEVAPGRLVWVAPGGGIKTGESPREAAEREVLEEAGHRISADRAVWTRSHIFEFEGTLIRQRETFFLVNTMRFEPRERDFEKVEERLFRGFRWWKIDEIRASEDIFAPRRLGEVLDELMLQGMPTEPIDVGV